MYRFEKLEVWKLAINYSKKLYLLADTFPKSELFGLTAQIKRAALSISSNIAEGSGSGTTKDFSHFLDIAIKSTIELFHNCIFQKRWDISLKNSIKNSTMNQKFSSNEFKD